MPHEQRNHLLKRLLEGYGIVVFPSDNHNSVDGLPTFNILFNDLKELLKDENNKMKDI
jgi:hypothetical protein